MKKRKKLFRLFMLSKNENDIIKEEERKRSEKKDVGCGINTKEIKLSKEFHTNCFC
jgi:hypothetical protein